jgi:hypothetical protein
MALTLVSKSLKTNVHTLSMAHQQRQKKYFNIICIRNINVSIMNFKTLQSVQFQGILASVDFRGRFSNTGVKFLITIIAKEC